MPAVDIYSGNALMQPKSVQDFDNDALQAQAKRHAIQTNALSNQRSQAELQQQQNMLGQRSALSGALQSGDIDLTNPAHVQRALAIAPDVAPGLLTSVGKYQQDQADVEQKKGAGAKAQAEAADQALKTYRGGLSLVRDPQGMEQWIRGLYSNPATAAIARQMSGSPEDAIARIPKDPGEFQQYLVKNALGFTDFIHDQTVQRGQDSSKEATLGSAKIHAGATLGAANISAAASRANNSATISKDYKVNGIDPQTGNFVGMGAAPGPAAPGALAAANPMAGMVDALGTYKMDPSQAFSRMAPGMKAGVIAAVQQKYPDYDPSTYSSKVKASRDFSTGAQGNAMRSFAVGLDHLDQLGKLADALDNGNLPLVNKVANIVAQQTGSTAPTNFDTAKSLVGKEIIKAVVGSAGGVEERKHAEDLLSSAHNPKQLRGVIQTFQGLMQAQHDALLQQRRAAGLPDSTLPAYHQTGGNASLHSQADAILNGTK